MCDFITSDDLFLYKKVQEEKKKVTLFSFNILVLGSKSYFYYWNEEFEDF